VWGAAGGRGRDRGKGAEGGGGHAPRPAPVTPGARQLVRGRAHCGRRARAAATRRRGPAAARAAPRDGLARGFPSSQAPDRWRAHRSGPPRAPRARPPRRSSPAGRWQSRGVRGCRSRTISPPRRPCGRRPTSVCSGPSSMTESALRCSLISSPLGSTWAGRSGRVESGVRRGSRRAGAGSRNGQGLRPPTAAPAAARPAHQPVPSSKARGALDDALQAQQAALGALVAHDQDARGARQRAEPLLLRERAVGGWAARGHRSEGLGPQVERLARPSGQREWDGAEGLHRGRDRRRRGGSNNGLVVAPYRHWARGWWHPHRQCQEIFWDGPGRARAGPQGAPPLGGCRGQGSIGRFFRARRRGQGPPAAAGPPPQRARRAEGRPLSMLAGARARARGAGAGSTHGAIDGVVGLQAVAGLGERRGVPGRDRLPAPAPRRGRATAAPRPSGRRPPTMPNPQ
jgi:hypothetical protein